MFNYATAFRNLPHSVFCVTGPLKLHGHNSHTFNLTRNIVIQFSSRPNFTLLTHPL